MITKHRRPFSLLLAAIVAGGAALLAQSPAIDWQRVETESMEHFQAVLRFDTSDPPGNERPAAEYLKQVLEREGHRHEGLRARAQSAERRRTAEGKRQEATAAPDGAHRHRQRRSRKVDVPAVQRDAQRRLRVRTRHGRRQRQRHRCADDDALLKRSGVALDRDVIFLAEAGEEGTTRVGIQFMAQQHFSRDRRRVLSCRRRQRPARRRGASAMRRCRRRRRSRTASC